MIIEDLKRFWGIGALYTLMLCLAGVFPILMNYDTLEKHGRHLVRSFLENETFFCYLFLMSAPIAAAVLIFRYMQQSHSTAVVHAFPFTRKQMFISHIISGILLILIPILVNSILLLFIKKPVYIGGDIPVDIFTASAIGNWALQSTLIVLVGFSIAVFAGIISGNSILQTIFGFGFLFLAPAVILLFITYFEKFLFGFTTSSKFDQVILNISPIVSKIDSYKNLFEIKCIVWYIVLTIIMFVISYILYNRRHLERATESIAFDWLKPIFKYSIAFCGMTVLGLYFMQLGDGKELNMYIGFFIGSLVSFIIAEMIVQKSIWVFKNLKGYLYFLIIAALFILCIQTDVLGYEKRLPDLNQVESIYIGNSSYRIEDNFDRMMSSEIIEQGYLYHQSIIENRKVLENAEDEYYQTVSICYYYKNGKILLRRYRIPRDFVTHNPYMKTIFESEEYKQVNETILGINIKDVDFLYIEPTLNPYEDPIRITDRDEINTLWNALTEDVLNKTYEEHYDTFIDLGALELVWKKSRDEIADDEQREYYYYTPKIKRSYTATIQWLRENGYMDKVMITAEDVSYIGVTKSLNNDDDRVVKELDTNFNSRVIPESTEDLMVVTDKDYIQDILSNLEKDYYSRKGGYNVFILLNDARKRPYYGYYQLETAPQFIQNYFD